MPRYIHAWLCIDDDFGGGMRASVFRLVGWVLPLGSTKLVE